MKTILIIGAIAAGLVALLFLRKRGASTTIKPVAPSAPLASSGPAVVTTTPTSPSPGSGTWSGRPPTDPPPAPLPFIKQPRGVLP